MSVDNLLQAALEKHKRMEYDAAIKLYMKILSAKPGHLDANYLLGTLYIDYPDLQKAKLYLTKASQINPNSPFVKVNLGHLYRKLGAHDLAIKSFAHAAQLMPNLYEAHLGLGTALIEIGEDPGKAGDCLERARRLAPNVPEIYHQMAVLSLRLGKTDDALKFFDTARGMNPKLEGVSFEIGKIYLSKGMHEKAAEYFREAALYAPGDVKAPYFLAIAEGRVPDNDLVHKYSQALFDGYSTTFEKRLVDKLGYSLPFKILDTLKRIRGGNFRFASVCDLGCGTGLAGEALRSSAVKLTGIDISEKMIEVARTKNCYNRLYCGDLVEVLDGQKEVFDLFVATDVLVYIGDLDALMTTVLSHAASGATFLFSTEALDGDGFVLQNSGRYAHSPRYVHEIVTGHGCNVVSEEVIDLRMEAGNWIKGNLFVVQLPDAGKQ